MRACARSRFPYLLHNVRSLYNVGAFFRSADAAGCDKLYLSGITGRPPHTGIAKTALGAEETVPWEHHPDPAALILRLRQQGHEIAAIETSVHSTDLYDWQPMLPGLRSVRARSGWPGRSAARFVRYLRAHSHARPQTFAQCRHRRRRGDLRTSAEIPASSGECKNKTMRVKAIVAAALACGPASRANAHHHGAAGARYS